jgi:hypothetical protein
VNRKQVAVRALVMAAVVGASVIVAIALLSPKRTSVDETSMTTTTTIPVLVDPNTAVIPLDPVTTILRATTPHRSNPTLPASSVARSNDRSSQAPTTAFSPTLRGAPPVSWALSGSCTHASANFICHVAVKASNGLQSAGFIEAFPESGYRNDCVVINPLARGAVSLSGECPYTMAPNVLIVYVLAPGPKAPVIAYAHFPWS